MVNLTSVCVLFTFFILSSCTVSHPQEKIVETKSGKILGVSGTSRDGRQFYQWLKIPFAQPPVGELRFATPKPVKKWDGILDARNWGPKCTQVEVVTYGISGQEDCLHLNVFVPKLETTNKKLPVLVFIHGGGYFYMSAKDFSPDYFMDEDLILITIQYRLGPLGFLSTGDKEIRGNMGLKDQQLALTWIKENIEYFGGNSESITISGESAGGASSHLMALSEKSDGLFHKVISSSCVANWVIWATSDMIQKTKNFAEKLNCPTDDSQKLTECLRALTDVQLVNGYVDDIKNSRLMNPTKSKRIFAPVVEAVDDEEAFLIQHPDDLVVQGRALRLPWMIGGTTDEGLVCTMGFYREPESLTEMDKNWKTYIPSLFVLPPEGASVKAEKIHQFYFPENKSDLTIDERFSRYTMMSSDGHFMSHISHGAKVQRQFSPVYLYILGRPDGPTIAHFLAINPTLMNNLSHSVQTNSNKDVLTKRKSYGTCHGDDLLLLFPTMGFFNIPKDDKSLDYAFSKDFVKLWADFVNDEKSMKFRNVKFSQTSQAGDLDYLSLEETKPRMMKEPNQNRMEFWEQIYNFKT